SAPPSPGSASVSPSSPTWLPILSPQTSVPYYRIKQLFKIKGSWKKALPLLRGIAMELVGQRSGSEQAALERRSGTLVTYNGIVGSGGGQRGAPGVPRPARRSTKAPSPIHPRSAPRVR